MTGPTGPLTRRAVVTRALAEQRVAGRAVFGVVLLTSLVVLFAPTAGGPQPFPYADKVVHLLLFAALAWSGQRAGVPVATLGVALVGYAVLSEVIQATLLPRRSGDWTDVAADLIGVAAGLLAGARREHFSGRPRREQGRP